MVAIHQFTDLAHICNHELSGASQLVLNANPELKQTALTRREILLFYYIAAMRSTFPSLDQGIFLGSFAAKFFVNRRHISRLPAVTDIDLYFSSLPEEVRVHSEKDYLTDVFKRTYSTRLGVTETVTLSEFPLYRLIGYTHIDLFEGSVGLVKPDSALDTVRPTIVLPDLGQLHLDLANPGILLATLLNPRAYTPGRIHRAQLIANSLRDGSTYVSESLEDVTLNCKRVLTHSGISAEDMVPVMKMIKSTYSKSNSNCVDLVEYLS